MKDATLGGYLRTHDRPPAFTGTDGASYSVDTLLIDDDPNLMPHVGGALLFVRWSADGAQPIGHLETDVIAVGANPEQVVEALHALTLHDVKAHLDRLIETAAGEVDW